MSIVLTYLDLSRIDTFADGFDAQMQANHLSHFLLTHEVWPLIEKAADTN